jgi:hypothetical protein
MQAIGLGNYCFEVHSTKTQKSSVLEQLATAWRERNLVTEEHWSTAAGISDRTKEPTRSGTIPAIAGSLNAATFPGSSGFRARAFPSAIHDLSPPC